MPVPVRAEVVVVGVGLVHRGTELAESVADRPGTAAYRVERSPGGTAVETRVDPRRPA
jgi:hypothetical protein